MTTRGGCFMFNVRCKSYSRRPLFCFGRETRSRDGERTRTKWGSALRMFG